MIAAGDELANGPACCLLHGNSFGFSACSQRFLLGVGESQCHRHSTYGISSIPSEPDAHSVAQPRVVKRLGRIRCLPAEEPQDSAGGRPVVRPVVRPMARRNRCVLPPAADCMTSSVVSWGRGSVRLSATFPERERTAAGEAVDAETADPLRGVGAIANSRNDAVALGFDGQDLLG